jgi:hypothetical protein
MTTTRATTMSRLRLALATAAVAAGALAAGAAPAAAASPCWAQVLNDWFVDGRIDRTYPVACYTQATQHIGEDAKQYSTAPDDIRRALLAAIRQDRPGGPGGGGGDSLGGGGGSSRSGGLDGGGGGTSAAPGAPAAPSDRNDRKGPVSHAFDWLAPANAESVPLPLLVLGGIALLLLATAAGSWLARRLQARRLRPAPAPSQQPPKSP